MLAYNQLNINQREPGRLDPDRFKLAREGRLGTLMKQQADQQLINDIHYPPSAGQINQRISRMYWNRFCSNTPGTNSRDIVTDLKMKTDEILYFMRVNLRPVLGTLPMENPSKDGILSEVLNIGSNSTKTGTWLRAVFPTFRLEKESDKDGGHIGRNIGSTLQQYCDANSVQLVNYTFFALPKIHKEHLDYTSGAFNKHEYFRSTQ